jgi:TIGR03643 family protein
LKHLTVSEISEIVADAWDDETSFENINFKWGLSEKDIKVLMKRSLKRTSYIVWRKRVKKRLSKHSLKTTHVVQHE